MVSKARLLGGFCTHGNCLSVELSLYRRTNEPLLQLDVEPKVKLGAIRQTNDPDGRCPLFIGWLSF